MLEWFGMKPRLVCIFAHPDDEAFGPSGSIHLLSKTYDVYLICVTKGDAGENHHPIKKDVPLITLRHEELEGSAKILGIKKVFFLNYEDGELCNNKYLEVAGKIQAIFDDLKPEVLLTDEHRGVSGHIDHIVVSMISSYLYRKLLYVKKIMFYCWREDQRAKEMDNYFIFAPPGLPKNQINEEYDITPVKDKKIEAINTHLSQLQDIKRVMRNFRNVECYYVWEKSI